MGLFFFLRPWHALHALLALHAEPAVYAMQAAFDLHPRIWQPLSSGHGPGRAPTRADIARQQNSQPHRGAQPNGDAAGSVQRCSEAGGCG